MQGWPPHYGRRVGGGEIEEFHANEEKQEMRAFPGNFQAREEIAKNSTQTKNSKKCVDFHAIDDSKEMLRRSIHAREEIEEI